MISLSRVNAVLLWDHNRSYNAIVGKGCGDRLAIIICSVQEVWGAYGTYKF